MDDVNIPTVLSNYFDFDILTVSANICNIFNLIELHYHINYDLKS